MNTLSIVEKYYVVHRTADGLFWTGLPNVFTADLSKAWVISQLEMEVMSLSEGEEWLEMPVQETIEDQ